MEIAVVILLLIVILGNACPGQQDVRGGYQPRLPPGQPDVPPQLLKPPAGDTCLAPDSRRRS